METLEKWINRGGDVNHTFRAQMPEGQAITPTTTTKKSDGASYVIHESDKDTPAGSPGTHLAEIDFASHLGANVVTHSLFNCISRT